MTKKRIKVVALIFSMKQGGAEQIVMNNLRDLSNDPDIEFKVVVFNTRSDSKYCREIEEQHYPVRFMNYPKSRIRIRYVRGILNRWIEWRAYEQVIREEQPDIVHVHISELLAKCLYGIKACNVPVRFDTLHSHPLRYKGWVLRIIRRAFQKENFIALCLSNEQYHIAKEYYGLKRHEILRNGIDFAGIRSRMVPRGDARESLEIADDAFVVAAVGRLDPIKNYVLMLDVFRVVIEREPKAILVIAGGGYQLRDLEEKCQRDGIRDHVRFLGIIDNPVPLYCAADVVVNTSFSEACSLVLLEAQCCGSRCVVSHGNCAEAIISDRVRLMEDKASLQEWASAILDKDYHGKTEFSEDDYEVHRQSQRLKEYYLRYYNEYQARQNEIHM